jgi:hypothetical protein
MLQMNSMKPVISFTNPFPYMNIRFSLMKQDASKDMRTVSVSTVKMRISCVKTIE